MKRTGPTNHQVKQLVTDLSTKDAPIWRRVVKDLQKPSRQRFTVNLYKIDKYAKDGETVIVPGKVLSVGNLSKKIDVAAMNFSTEAKKKIEQAQGKIFTISQLAESNPEGKKVRIMG